MKNRNLNHKDDWKTPPSLIDELTKEFGKMFDPCPLNHNILLWDGLKIPWKKVNFINPPYSRPLKDLFVKKAYEESLKGKLCILLLPVSTSTVLFHEYIYGKAEIRFLRKRVKFLGINTKGEYVDNISGMHDSMIVIFGKYEQS